MAAPAPYLSSSATVRRTASRPAATSASQKRSTPPWAWRASWSHAQLFPSQPSGSGSPRTSRSRSGAPRANRSTTAAVPSSEPSILVWAAPVLAILYLWVVDAVAIRLGV
ncbi:MAG TPA: hypothetical protein VF746_17455 [Longimicrobium sp.]